jgi:diacylglycerol kinase
MKKWLISARNALKGVYLLLRYERNARIEFVCAFVVIGLGLWLTLSTVEWVLILLCIGLVLSTEAVNSAIERLGDLYTKENKPEIGQLKDISAGAVFILAFISLCIGIIILLPKMIRQLGL